MGRLLPLVDGDFRHAPCVMDDHPNVAGPVVVGRIGETHRVGAVLGQFHFESSRLRAPAFAAVVGVAPRTDEGAVRRTETPIPRQPGLGVVDDDAGQRSRRDPLRRLGARSQSTRVPAPCRAAFDAIRNSRPP